MLGTAHFGPKKFKASKYFWNKSVFVPKNLCSQKIDYFSHDFFWTKKMIGRNFFAWFKFLFDNIESNSRIVNIQVWPECGNIQLEPFPTTLCEQLTCCFQFETIYSKEFLPPIGCTVYRKAEWLGNLCSYWLGG